MSSRFLIASTLYFFAGVAYSNNLPKHDLLNVMHSTTHSSPLLLPALLTAFRKRRHAETHYVRTTAVFPSRQALLEYEEYLALETRIEEAFSSQAVLHLSSKKVQGKGKLKEKEGSSFISRRVEGARVVRDIWTDVYDRWKVLISCKDEEDRPSGLERFDCGTSVLLNLDLVLSLSSIRAYLNKNRRECWFSDSAALRLIF